MRPGYCRETASADEGNCAQGDKGSWRTSELEEASLTGCALRCLSCWRCQYVSWSSTEDEGCSWFHECPQDELPQANGFVTVDASAWIASGSPRSYSPSPTTNAAQCGRKREWFDRLRRLAGSVSFSVFVYELEDLVRIAPDYARCIATDRWRAAGLGAGGSHLAFRALWHAPHLSDLYTKDPAAASYFILQWRGCYGGSHAIESADEFRHDLRNRLYRRGESHLIWDRSDGHDSPLFSSSAPAYPRMVALKTNWSPMSVALNRLAAGVDINPPLPALRVYKAGPGVPHMEGVAWKALGSRDRRSCSSNSTSSSARWSGSSATRKYFVTFRGEYTSHAVRQLFLNFKGDGVRIELLCAKGHCDRTGHVAGLGEVSWPGQPRREDLERRSQLDMAQEDANAYADLTNTTFACATATHLPQK